MIQLLLINTMKHAETVSFFRVLLISSMCSYSVILLLQLACPKCSGCCVRKRYLSEERPVEGDGVEAVHSPHGDVQVHQQPLLLLSVHCRPDPLTADRKPQSVKLLSASGNLLLPVCSLTL